MAVEHHPTCIASINAQDKAPTCSPGGGPAKTFPRIGVRLDSQSGQGIHVCAQEHTTAETHHSHHLRRSDSQALQPLHTTPSRRPRAPRAQTSSGPTPVCLCSQCNSGLLYFTAAVSERGARRRECLESSPLTASSSARSTPAVVCHKLTRDHAISAFLSRPFDV